ncbi:Lsr2 family protein [Allokutzneria sp. A3M-2-11 16]|uniref:histone-like nucleoid-structuring protein Lsr2 n=1 Tax=Allokutzneria sp. A3M-2-11 16 TaxID=2962043 RepID=UPI0020B71EBD|nr:Lsr2 family protein [Allokutzneria sp. A3M-2-11 16]MCP3801997.1 Lsr2 family protein [Allokutzneria sp. A3M-2-11 16]
MAQRMIVQLIDDLDGVEAPSIACVEFGLDGQTYEIDLNKANANRLRTVLAPFVEAARPVDRLNEHGACLWDDGGSERGREVFQAIRTWARMNGHEIADGGPLPHAVLHAYKVAKSLPATPWS